MKDEDLKLAKLLEYMDKEYITLYENNYEMTVFGFNEIIKDMYRYEVVKIAPGNHCVNVYVTKVKETDIKWYNS